MHFDEETGEFEYDGETEVNWDSQETITNKAGNSKLSCPNFHTWFSKQTNATA